MERYTHIRNKYFGSGPGPGSERTGPRHPERLVWLTRQPSREGREAAGRGVAAAGAQGGKEKRRRRAHSSPRPGVPAARCGRASAQGRSVGAPSRCGRLQWAALDPAGRGRPLRAGGRGRAGALRAGAGPGWSTGAPGAPATKGCDPLLVPPSRLRSGQSERLLLAGGRSRLSCSEAPAW